MPWVASWLADASRANGRCSSSTTSTGKRKSTLLMPLHALGAGAPFSDDARVLVVASARRRVGAVRLPPRPATSGRATL
jgi:hypothetical protein